MSETIQFDPIQLEAINKACDQTLRVVAITGSAGTGKTSIMEEIYNRLVNAGYTVVLCSPTGKAAKNIFDRTGIPAQTIHRLLEYTHPGDINEKTGKPEGYSYPRRNQESPLEFDIILADEYAMVNREVHLNLIQALKSGARIIMFGDKEQLAPIEDEDRFADKNAPKEDSSFVKILKNPKLTSVILKTVFRQGKDSGILVNLEMLLKSRMPSANEQWEILFTDQPVTKLQNLILDKYFDDTIPVEQRIDFKSTANQIIVPQNTSWVGTQKLNFILQNIYFPSGEAHLKIPRHKWDIGVGNVKGEEGGYIKLHVGDKVIYKSNNADLQVFNGETGVVIEFNEEFGDLVIDFGDREQTIPPVQMKTNQYGKLVEFDPRKDIDLAYAITTHKSQGSQYDNVVYIMNKANAFMLNARNYYTACSRAKKKVFVITDQISASRTVYKRD